MAPFSLAILCVRRDDDLLDSRAGYILCNSMKTVYRYSVVSPRRLNLKSMGRARED